MYICLGQAIFYDKARALCDRKLATQQVRSAPGPRLVEAISEFLKIIPVLERDPAFPSGVRGTPRSLRNPQQTLVELGFTHCC